MGKKMAIISILFLLSWTIKTYGQEVKDDKIEWDNLKLFENKSFPDTCQIKEQYEMDFTPIGLTSNFQWNDRHFFCCSHGIGSGIPMWIIQVFELKKEWQLVFEKSIVKRAFISSSLDSLRNKIVFYGGGLEIDSVTQKMNIRKDEIIGEVKISDL